MHTHLNIHTLRNTSWIPAKASNPLKRSGTPADHSYPLKFSSIWDHHSNYQLCSATLCSNLEQNTKNTCKWNQHDIYTKRVELSPKELTITLASPVLGKISWALKWSCSASIFHPMQKNPTNVKNVSEMSGTKESTTPEWPSWHPTIAMFH